MAEVRFTTSRDLFLLYTSFLNMWRNRDGRINYLPILLVLLYFARIIQQYVFRRDRSIFEKLQSFLENFTQAQFFKIDILSKNHEAV